MGVCAGAGLVGAGVGAAADDRGKYHGGAGFGVASQFIGAMLVMPLAFLCRGATVRFYDRECRALPLHAGGARFAR